MQHPTPLWRRKGEKKKRGVVLSVSKNALRNTSFQSYQVAHLGYNHF